MKRGLLETLSKYGGERSLEACIVEHKIYVPTQFYMSQSVGANYRRLILAAYLEPGWGGERELSVSVRGAMLGYLMLAIRHVVCYH